MKDESKPETVSKSFHKIDKVVSPVFSQITEPGLGQSSAFDPSKLLYSNDQLHPGQTTNLQSSGKCQ